MQILFSHFSVSSQSVFCSSFPIFIAFTSSYSVNPSVYRVPRTLRCSHWYNLASSANIFLRALLIGSCFCAFYCFIRAVFRMLSVSWSLPGCKSTSASVVDSSGPTHQHKSLLCLIIGRFELFTVVWWQICVQLEIDPNCLTRPVASGWANIWDLVDL